ncbi:MAG: AmmeMemoRadiSam system protein A [Candidatus Omnitrophica bacterium]|nr:AmmeMemoRadiSam system protein A [Candidatus Omnitrophota bacterium]
MFHKLSLLQKEWLLKSARGAIEGRLLRKPHTVPEPAPAGLDVKRGVFVSLYVKEELRGCIGAVEPDRPLRELISVVAIDAAFCDPRFPELALAELDEVRMEISVLSEPEEIHGPDEVRVGEDGLLIRKGAASGLLLPQVAVQHRFSPREFLRQVSLKAGLKPGAWREGARLWRFQAEVFGGD